MFFDFSGVQFLHFGRTGWVGISDGSQINEISM